MSTYLIVFVGAMVLSLGATALAIRLAPRIGAMDNPGVRKVHATPTPRIGGVAIVLAVFASALLAVASDGAIRRGVFRDAAQTVGLLGAAAIVFGVGLVDDLRGLRARHKLAGQLAAAAILCAVGVRIEALGAVGSFRIEFGWLSWPLTMLWVVGITNSVNLIDGVDGLAAGISAVACVALAALALQAQHTFIAVIMLAMLGGLTGFLFFNFNPARIFLGDCGSLFLGFMLAGTSVLGSAKTAAGVGLALPLLAMGIPVFDTLASLVRRVLERRSVFSPDRQHIHHRLMRMGLRQRHVALVLYGAAGLSAALGMFMMTTSGAGALVLFFCLLLLLGLFLRAVGVLRPRGALEAARRMARHSKRSRDDRRLFEEARLLVREAPSMAARWQVVAETAEKMGAVRLAIRRRRKRAVWQTVLCHHSPGSSDSEAEVVRMSIPLPVGLGAARLRAELDLRPVRFLEGLGRRLALLGRLIDETLGSPVGADEARANPPQKDAAERYSQVA